MDMFNIAPSSSGAALLLLSTVFLPYAAAGLLILGLIYGMIIAVFNEKSLLTFLSRIKIPIITASLLVVIYYVVVLGVSLIGGSFKKISLWGYTFMLIWGIIMTSCMAFAGYVGILLGTGVGKLIIKSSNKRKT